MRSYVIYDSITDQFLVSFEDNECEWDGANSYEYGNNDFLPNLHHSALFSTKKDGNKAIKLLTKLFLEHDKDCEIDFQLVDCKPKTIYVVH